MLLSVHISFNLSPHVENMTFPHCDCQCECTERQSVSNPASEVLFGVET